MISPDDFSIKDDSKSEQYDFFEVLDNVVPNEDYREYPLDKFGTLLCFDPKCPNCFEISNPSAQITGTISFDKNGNITDMSLARWHSESGEIEKSWRERFKADASKAIAEYGAVLKIEKPN